MVRGKKIPSWIITTYVNYFKKRTVSSGTGPENGNLYRAERQGGNPHGQREGKGRELRMRLLNGLQ
jgi:hypothetical protein